MTQSEQNTPASTSARCRVLVVDDLERIHEDFRRVLVQSKHDREQGDKLLRDAQSLLGQFGADTTASTHDEDYLESLCVDMDFAFQGQEAVEKVRIAQKSGTPYDVAFVDMRMPPGWDGLQTIERIWEIQPELQVVICTAYSDYSWSEILRRVGQRENLLVLKKPFDSIEVHQMVSALSRRMQSTRQGVERESALKADILTRERDLKALREEHLRERKVLSGTVLQVQEAAEHMSRSISSSASHSDDGAPMSTLKRRLDDMVDYLEIAAGKLKFDHEPFDLIETIAQCVRLMEIPDADGIGIEVKVDFDRSLPRIVVGDPARLARVVQSMIDDAYLRSRRDQVRLDVSVLRFASQAVTLRLRATAVGGIHVSHDANGLGVAELLVLMMHGDVELDADYTTIRINLEVPPATKVG